MDAEFNAAEINQFDINGAPVRHDGSVAGTAVLGTATAGLMIGTRRAQSGIEALSISEASVTAGFYRRFSAPSRRSTNVQDAARSVAVTAEQRAIIVRADQRSDRAKERQ